MRTILVEGWRLIPHSYAIVNQHYCMEFLKRPDIRLYHRDIPFFAGNWTKTTGLFTPEDEARITGIPSPPPGLKPELVRCRTPMGMLAIYVETLSGQADGDRERQLTTWFYASRAVYR